MSATSIARRYAKALLAIGTEDGRFEQYADEIARVEQAYLTSPELQDLWTNPAHGREERLAGLDRIASPLAFSPAVTNLMRLFVERQRVGELPALKRAYQAMVDEKLGRVRAVVSSARPLDAAQRAELQRSLASATRKQILLQERVDGSLIGGVTAQVGSTIFDGSVRTQLERLRQSLSEGV